MISLEKYQGRVELVTAQYSLLAYADYEVILDTSTGVETWGGLVAHIDPILSLYQQGYEMKRPDGTVGRILVPRIEGGVPEPQVAIFIGSGPAPGRMIGGIK